MYSKEIKVSEILQDMYKEEQEMQEKHGVLEVVITSEYCIIEDEEGILGPW